jgi:threonine/homoserine/homoserine lactone efflux protein
LQSSHIFAFTLMAALVTISPGPDTFLVIGNTAHAGAKRGLATVAGIVSGGFFHATLFALGLANILLYSPQVFLAVKLLGAAYLFYLGIGGLRAAIKPCVVVSVANTEPTASSHWRAYRQGLLTNALNPKVAIFYLAFLPQFMSPGEPIALQSALLIAIHYLLGLLWLSLLVLGVNSARAWLRKSAVQRCLDGVVGAVMTSFGIKLALTSREM